MTFSALKTTFRIVKVIFSSLKVTFRNVKVTFSRRHNHEHQIFDKELLFLRNELS